MPDAVKIAKYGEERQEAKRPQPVGEPGMDGQHGAEHRADEQPPAGQPSASKGAGFFRLHPSAKWVLAVLAAAVLVGGIFVWRYYSVRESTDDAQVDAHIDPISARISGTALRVLADDNEVVKAGTPLVELDPKDYEVAVQRARADLADAQANASAAGVNVPLTSATSSSQLNSANAGVIGAQKDIEAAKAKVQQDQANSVKAEADLRRYEELVRKDEISRQQYDAAVAAAAAARAALEADNAAVANAESREVQAQAQAASAATAPQLIRVSRARATAALAEVEKSRAALAQAELNLQYTRIAAPVDGILDKRNVEPGQTVQAGQPLFSIVNLGDIWITADFKETQLRNMKVGQRVNIHVDAYVRDYQGHIESIGGATGARFSLLPPENATGNYVKVVQRVPVRIRLDQGEDREHLLRPGLSVEPTVFLK